MAIHARLIFDANQRELSMADTELVDKSHTFAGADDEGEDFLDYITPPAPQPDVSEPDAGAFNANPLFFATSDDEDDVPMRDVSPFVRLRSESVAPVASPTDNADGKRPYVECARASSVSSISSAAIAVPSSPASSVHDTIPEPPRKKRKLSPEATKDEKLFTSAYLGSFLVANAWSTVRGKGYVQVSPRVSWMTTIIDRPCIISLVTKFASSAKYHMRYLLRRQKTRKVPRMGRIRAGRNNFLSQPC